MSGTDQLSSRPFTVIEEVRAGPRAEVRRDFIISTCILDVTTAALTPLASAASLSSLIAVGLSRGRREEAGPE
eukprot:CAMPEP_0182463276 /NCGR_PEP_ID=MMETSP1319-20130603/7249_1 /TAXON_ID=172717 /ORGANISM="Bolidomonas pacifica, Strain RCC208" /LENGTH=72 /DNA_ID=CAMNT_0024662797 /DNA_START=193 /DNA_END=411 /DNA_ORIENTATION=-